VIKKLGSVNVLWGEPDADQSVRSRHNVKRGQRALGALELRAPLNCVLESKEIARGDKIERKEKVVERVMLRGGRRAHVLLLENCPFSREK